MGCAVVDAGSTHEALHPATDQSQALNICSIHVLRVQKTFELCCTLVVGVELLLDAEEAAAPPPPPGPVMGNAHT